MTIWTAINAAGAAVYDVELNERINQVVAVNTKTGEVECGYTPCRPHPYHADRIDTYTLVFGSIYAIQGLEKRPCLFHCYGRLN